MVRLIGCCFITEILMNWCWNSPKQNS